MKKYWIILLCTVVALGACSKNNNPEEEDELPAKMGDLECIQESLVSLDENGNIAGYIVGASLNEADPSEVSVPVDNYEQALALFRSLLPADANPAVSGKTYTLNMVNEMNEPEGQAVFAESTAPGLIATLSISAKGAKVSSVRFIPTSAWPENSSAMEEYLEDYYYLGAEIEITENKGASTGTYVVIREWTPQEAGIMIRFSGDTFHTNTITGDGMNQTNCSSVNSTQTVSRVLHQGQNYEYFVKKWGPRHNWPSLDNRYMTKKTSKGGFLNGTKYWHFVNLETGEEIKLTDNLYTNKSYYKVYIYWFGPNGDKVIYW